ncbi:MAG: hypothetical protein IPH16_05225 [Haliscomenobacter sp.]|nr:hypothetical protein [Haliscomenobacter sp.]MBK8655470.1 hypothetical protein [Haliscomenobacter sp.]
MSNTRIERRLERLLVNGSHPLIHFVAFGAPIDKKSDFNHKDFVDPLPILIHYFELYPDITGLF